MHLELRKFYKIVYSILVNTTDSFEACWKPFFKLFKIYWPDYMNEIYLNTEFKNFSYDNVNIIPVKNNVSGGVNNWGLCLKKALDFISTDIVLYLQEDYFLDDFVKSEVIDYYVNLLRMHNLTYIGLTPFATKQFKEQDKKELWYLNENIDYRLSLQASLWDKSKMYKYIKNNDTPWKFEVKGTQRIKNDKGFYCVNRNVYNFDNQIVPYKPTGVVKGKWNKKVIDDLFKKHNIEIWIE